MADAEALTTMQKRARPIARQVRAARGYADLTQAQLAEKLRVDEQTVMRYEGGEWKRPPKPLVLAEIARVCEIPQAWIDVGFLADPDPARRIARGIQGAGRPPAGHPPPSPEVPPDEDGQRKDG